MDAYRVEKHFPEWIGLKGKLHYIGRTPRIKEGEVWWCAIGENVGVEINGKGSTFARPVLILRKYSRYNFLAIPLTSKIHEGNWFTSFRFKGREQYACLTQARGISTSRLYSKMGEVPGADFQVVLKGFYSLHFPKKYSPILRLG